MSNNYTPNHTHNHSHQYSPNYNPNQPYFAPYPAAPFVPHRGGGRGAPYPPYIPTSPHYAPPPFVPQTSPYGGGPYYPQFKPSAPSSPSPSPVLPVTKTTPKKTIQITKSDGTVPEFIAKKAETSNNNSNTSGGTPSSLSSAPTSAAGSTASSPLSSSASSPLASPLSINVTKKDGGEVKFDFKEMAKEILNVEANDEKAGEKEIKEEKKEEEVPKEISNNNDKDNNDNNVDKKEEEKIEKKIEEVEQVKEEIKKEEKEEKVEIKNEEIKEETKEQTTTTTTTAENEEDSWENRGEDDLADLQDNRDDIENFDPNRIWRPDFEEGERVYTLDFLTKFQEFCKDKPEGMAAFDINVDYRGGGGGDWRGSRGYGGSQGSGGGGGRGGGRGGNQSRNSPKSPHRGGYRDRDSNFGKKSRERIPSDNRENPLVKKTRDLSKVELVLKTAKGLLNKLTFEKFNSLSEKIVNVGIDEETLEPIIKLVFEKAVSEPKYSMMYTKLCKILSVKYPTYQRNGETISFRRILLNKCQEEFENKKIITDAENLSKEELDELDFKIRNRMKGNITFIGELFKEKMLNDQIIHYCINHLLGDINNPDSANIEGLCRFFTTIGKMLDSEKNKEKIDKYFEKLKFIKEKSNLSTRIKFAIDDVFDLRKNKWVPRRADEAPDTIKAVHKSIESKQSSTPPSSPHRKEKGGGGGGRGGSSSNISSKEYRKVEHSSSNSSLHRDNNNNNSRDNNNNRESNNNSNSNISNSNFGVKKLQPEKNKFNQFAALQTSSPASSPPSSPSISSPRGRDLSAKEMKSLLYNNVDEFLAGQPLEIEEYRDIKLEDLNVVVEIFLYLISKNLDANKISSLFETLLTSSFISQNYFVDGLNKIIENYEDYAEDFPKLSSRIAIILLHLISKDILPLSQLADLDTDQLIIPFLLRREIRDQFVDLLSNFHSNLAAESVKKEAFQFLTLLSKSNDDEYNKKLLSKVNLSEKENDFLSEVSSLLKSSFSRVGVERVKKVISELKLVNEQKLSEQLN